MTCLVTKIQEWREGEWYFRAKECSDFKWHVWCSKSELVGRDALNEPWDSMVYFEFDNDRQSAIERLKWQTKTWRKLWH
ncbi:hypothetical protein [Chamaesiphon sp. OTE_8_metabat_110]|uniref:hypothetical protein n=1 Tax=Chamaesiphon sp. OTE_8_metabat_110 TaxID=2964696 RepID=UPI00286ABDBC|nr:hypothetical protein [Chamaesiphon sp. OTE_8_metabat_110]